MSAAPVSYDGDAPPPSAAARLDDVLASLDRLDESARDPAYRAVAAVVDLYGEAVTRLLDLAGNSAAVRVDDLVADETWSALLSLHGVHPVAPATRAETALEEIRPALARHGGNVRVVGVDDGVLTVELLGGCQGCGASQETLRGLVETAALAAVPEITSVLLVEAPPAPKLLQIGRRPEHVACEVGEPAR